DCALCVCRSLCLSFPHPPGLFSLISMAIWAHQENTHEHLTKLCDEKTYFVYGRSFGLCIVGWLLCFVNIGIRAVFAGKFVESSPYAVGGTGYDASLVHEAPKAPGGSAYNTL
ncbi:MAG: hypothetical protein P4L40_10650, partial [Terracidiphilus sp.]|nr:hypothetical protein [Terracidiphilus sp.]